MPIDPAAFRHHPRLEGKIRAPEDSFFRDLDLEVLDARMREAGAPADWRYPDARREEMRRAALTERLQAGGEFWVFAYGSLMWDPAVDVMEIRRATLQGYSRAMCLVDRFGGRGTPEAPGLMAGLDDGGTCEGLAFRLPPDGLERETERLWRREMVAPAYHAVFAPAQTAQGEVTALAFAADHSADMIEADLPRETQLRYLATGEGMLGTSLEYLENLLVQFELLDIHDPDLAALCRDAQALRAENSLLPER
ncbi:gamma-glutamylcyclotransferase [Aquicoccus sp. SCR17]|nr:gamma-glutamylcyclotransferase [Carideicomes alvinocaridis]